MGEGCTNKDLSIYEEDNREGGVKGDNNKRKDRFASVVVCVCALGHERQVVVVVVMVAWGMG